MATYSFMDVSASMTGPTGVIDLGYGSANSDEGDRGRHDRGEEHHDYWRRR